MTNLAKVLAAYQQKFDVEAKALASDMDISESTLCRIKQGKMPDALGITKILNWLVSKK